MTLLNKLYQSEADYATSVLDITAQTISEVKQRKNLPKDIHESLPVRA
jgi:hypothetical protein